jgi:hypothetical protein
MPLYRSSRFMSPNDSAQAGRGKGVQHETET